MSVAAAPDFDTQLVRGIQTALRQARGLGDHVETMDITASVSDGVCHIHFSPIQRAIHVGWLVSRSLFTEATHDNRS